MTQAEPVDARELRAEIERTRSELGDTIEALAAKTDVAAHAKHAMSRARGEAKATVGAVRSRVRHSLSTMDRFVGDRLRSGRVAARPSEGGAGRPARLGSPSLPMAMLVGGAAGFVAVLIYLVRQRRRHQ